MKKELDFIVIGAAKAGTTSLAAYLGESPQIYIPPAKEIPYFLNEDMQKKGWDWYCNTYFRHADPCQLWGTSTPQYMMYPESFGEIKSALPNVKLIVTLRDPVARLLSHFDMSSRFGVEKRPLNQVVEEQLGRIEHYRQSAYHDRTGKYIVTGEYGRILSELFRHFDRSQVLVVDLDEIRKDAQQVMDRISEFLGVEHFIPGNLHTVRMKGGGRKRIPVDHDRIIAMLSKAVRSIGIAGLIPEAVKLAVGRLSQRLDQWNVDPSVKSRIEDLRPDLLERLRRHYRDDAIRLERFAIQTPWLERWDAIQVQKEAESRVSSGA